MNTQEKYDLISRAREIYERAQKTDSKAESDSLKAELSTMTKSLKSLNGTLVRVGDKTGRIWHSYYSVFKVYGKSRSMYTWSGNYFELPAEFTIIEEDNDELLDSIGEIDSEISRLENEIYKLKMKKNEMLKDFIPFVNPDDLVETEIVNRSAFSLGGSPVYIKEGFCELTGLRVES